MVLVIIYVMSVRVMLTGGGQGVEAVLWVRGGVAMSEKSFLARGQV